MIENVFFKIADFCVRVVLTSIFSYFILCFLRWELVQLTPYGIRFLFLASIIVVCFTENKKDDANR